MTLRIVPLLLLVGCASTRTPLPQPCPATGVVASSNAASPTTEVDAEPLELATSPECRWRGPVRGLDENDGVRLCLEPGRFCYATARQDLTAWVSVGAGRDPIALVEFENWGMTLGSVMAMRSIELHLQGVHAFGGYFVPFDARVAPGGTWRNLEAELDVGSVVKPTTMILFCREVGLSGPMQRPVPDDSDGEPASITAERVPLSAEPGGPTLVTISPDSLPHDAVQSIRRKDRSVQISLHLGSGYVQGWVPASAVGPYRRLEISGAQSGGSGGCDSVWAPVEQPVSGAVCSKTIPLFARVESRTARVGRIYQGTRVRLGATHDGVVRVELPRPRYRNCRNEERENPDVSLLQGAELFVRAPDARACH